jgi:hypothetical protein
MKYNLFAPMSGALPYPHYTKFANGEAFVVTHPERIIKEGDIIHSTTDRGVIDFDKRKVEKVLEHRTARGKHSVDFVPVFQKLKVVAV